MSRLTQGALKTGVSVFRFIRGRIVRISVKVPAEKRMALGKAIRSVSQHQNVAKVWRAMQKGGALSREVALKILTEGKRGTHANAAFKRGVAKLDIPNKKLEAGTISASKTNDLMGFFGSTPKEYRKALHARKSEAKKVFQAVESQLPREAKRGDLTDRLINIRAGGAKVIRENGKIKIIRKADPEKISKRLMAKYGAKVHLYETQAGDWYLGTIHVPKGARKQGTGTKIMNEIISRADQQGKRVTLTPGDLEGTTSTARLKKFYKQFGFKLNAGRSKDFSLSAGMIRKPKK